MFKLLFLLFIPLFIIGVHAKEVKKLQVITVWNYYLSPPFITSENDGLIYDFVKLLNLYTDKYFFKLKTIPRSRLNKSLNKKESGVVLFVNSSWMGKNAKENFLWSNSIWKDENQIISSIKRKIVYENNNSLKGLIFGAIRGRKLKPFINNNTYRYDVDNEKQLFAMLLKNRIDVTSQPKSIVLALIKEMKIENEIFISPKPLFTFTRHIMVSPELTEVHNYLNNLIDGLETNKIWYKISIKYNLTKKK